jgi:hypothetical protein
MEANADWFGLLALRPPEQHAAVGIGALEIVVHTPTVCRLGELLVT